MSNYIEEKLKEFNNWYDDLDDGLYQADKSEIRDFIKQALQEQEERIREEEYQRRKRGRSKTVEVNYKTGYWRAREEMKRFVPKIGKIFGFNVVVLDGKNNDEYDRGFIKGVEFAKKELLKELNI
jgi:hypothetical protein